jgi:hypothetical protein
MFQDEKTGNAVEQTRGDQKTSNSYSNILDILPIYSAYSWCTVTQKFDHEIMKSTPLHI